MKHSKKLTIFIILIIFVFYFYKKYEENQVNDYNNLKKQGVEVAAHRVNIESKLLELTKMGINNIEVDVHMQDKKLIVGHEAENSVGQALEDYLDLIEKANPNYTFMWLDFKDLTEDNQDVIFEKLEALDKKFNLKNRVLIESRYVNALQVFNKNGWKTGYYLKYDLGSQSDEYIKNVINDLHKTKTPAITFDCKHINFAYDKFKNVKLNNGNYISLNCWDLKQKRFSKSDLEKVKNIDRILISIKTRNNL